MLCSKEPFIFPIEKKEKIYNRAKGEIAFAERKVRNQVFGKIREVKAQKKIIDKVLQLRNQC